jgi:ferredoxin-NADP reductase
MGTTSKLKLISSYAEAGNICTFVFEADGLEWLAGQNQAYILPQAGETTAENERWFTISSPPSSGTINISTRISDSAFKQALNALKPGDSIERHTINGDFTWEDESDSPVVLVAGGIGVTPFHSILLERHAVGKSLNATMLHFNRDEQIPFQAQFEQLLEQHPELTIQYVTGPVTAERILELAPQSKEQVTYLSGPEAMVMAVSKELKKLGVTPKQDEFPGYDEKNF